MRRFSLRFAFSGSRSVSKYYTFLLALFGAKLPTPTDRRASSLRNGPTRLRVSLGLLLDYSAALPRPREHRVHSPRGRSDDRRADEWRRLNGSRAVVLVDYVIHRQRWTVSVRSDEGGPPCEVGMRLDNLHVLAMQPEGVISVQDWLKATKVEGLVFRPELPPMLIDADWSVMPQEKEAALLKEYQRQGPSPSSSLSSNGGRTRRTYRRKTMNNFKSSWTPGRRCPRARHGVVPSCGSGAAQQARV